MFRGTKKSLASDVVLPLSSPLKSATYCQITVVICNQLFANVQLGYIILPGLFPKIVITYYKSDCAHVDFIESSLTKKQADYFDCSLKELYFNNKRDKIQQEHCFAICKLYRNGQPAQLSQSNC